MDEELKVLNDWDALTDKLAARSINTDMAWTVMQLADQRRIANALERLAATHGGQLNMLTLKPQNPPDWIHDELRPEPVISGEQQLGYITSRQRALVLQVRDSLRDLLERYGPNTRLGIKRTELTGMLRYLNMAMGEDVDPDNARVDGVDADEGPRR